MGKRKNKILAAALSCSIASTMLGSTAALAAGMQTGVPGTVSEQQVLTTAADMSKYFGDWELYQIDTAPVTSDDQVIKFAIKDDHSFKIDGEDYKWTVYEDGERMQVLSMDGGDFGLVTMEGDSLVHYLAGSKWYFKRAEQNPEADMSKYFGNWELYQIDTAPVTSDDQVIKFAIKDDHSFKIDGEDYKWTVYEDGERMQVLSMDGGGFGLVTMEGDSLVHYLAGSKWYFKRADNDISTTTEIVTDSEITTNDIVTDIGTEITTNDIVTDIETEITTNDIVTDIETEITTNDIVTDLETEITTNDIVTDLGTEITTNDIVTDIETEITTNDIVTDLGTEITTNDIVTDIGTEITTNDIVTDPENATYSDITTEDIYTDSETETTANEPDGKTLPVTGMSGFHKVFAGLSALMAITGARLVKKSRKDDEE